MRVLKKDVCIDAQISPGFLTDLLAGRGCAGPDVVDRLSSSLGVRPAAIFPELAAKPWTSPLPDRAARRERAA